MLKNIICVKIGVCCSIRFGKIICELVLMYFVIIFGLMSVVEYVRNIGMNVNMKYSMLFSIDVVLVMCLVCDDVICWNMFCCGIELSIMVIYVVVKLMILIGLNVG